MSRQLSNTMEPAGSIVFRVFLIKAMSFKKIILLSTVVRERIASLLIFLFSQIFLFFHASHNP